MSPANKKKTAKKTTVKKEVVKKTASKKKAIAKKTSVKKKAVKKKASQKKTTAKKKAKAATLVDVSPEERWKMIAEAAYLKAEKRGFTGGNELDDWTEAEQEVDALLN